jgi:DNA-binding NtrC family response regulator
MHEWMFSSTRRSALMTVALGDAGMTESPTKLVMVVDDYPDILKMVNTILASIGYRVLSASGADAALRQIDREAPDVILTDIQMADGDGLELINAVRERRLSIPIVAMSGGSGTFGIDHLASAQKLGAVSIVDKPFRSAHLAEAIDRALGRRPAPPRKS